MTRLALILVAAVVLAGCASAPPLTDARTVLALNLFGCQRIRAEGAADGGPMGHKGTRSYCNKSLGSTTHITMDYGGVTNP